MVNDAAPLPSSVREPMLFAPSMKLTVPVGTPAAGATAATVAVKVTDWPNTDGFTEETAMVVVLPGLTTCATALEVLAVKLVSPPYTALMECGPGDSEARLSCAWPDPSSVTGEPSVPAPSMNCTVPVATPLNCGLTVAVNVTDWPKTEGLAEETTAVVVLACETVREVGPAVAGSKLASPEYEAVTECGPTPRAASGKGWLAELPVSVTGVRALPSTEKVTVPVGVPAPPELTVAVAVTTSPYVGVLDESVSDKVVVAGMTVMVTTADVLATKFVSPEY